MRIRRSTFVRGICLAAAIAVGTALARLGNHLDVKTTLITSLVAWILLVLLSLLAAWVVARVEPQRQGYSEARRSMHGNDTFSKIITLIGFLILIAIILVTFGRVR